MKGTKVILISLFILVIGISCASAADMNNHSIADNKDVKADFGDGTISATTHNALNSKRPDLWLTRDNDQPLGKKLTRDNDQPLGKKLTRDNDQPLGKELTQTKRPDLWLSHNENPLGSLSPNRPPLG